MKNDDNRGYEVGYGKPPKSGQFAKGHSGNPNGRPKGSKNFASIILRQSRQPVRINGPRGVRTITKLEASMMQVTNEAAKGSVVSQRLLFQLVQWSEMAEISNGGRRVFEEADRDVMRNILLRMGQIGQEESAATHQANQETQHDNQQ